MRRKLLMAAILGSGAAASGLTLSLLTAAKAWAEDAGSDSTAPGLAEMARLMFPHDVPESVYVEVIESVLSAAASNPALKQSLDQALSALDVVTGGDFAASDTSTQLEAMQSTATQPWFAAIQGQVLPRVYNHPVIWKHIGYPGSSVEYGGYKDRGFNDIDWLPADNS